MALPPGYGYANAAGDLSGLVYILMNHHDRAESVSVRYTVGYVTGQTLTPVRPIWLGVHNCQVDPIFTVPGTGGQGSTYSRSTDFRLPVSGRIVAGGGHLHGGGVRLDLTDTTCGTTVSDYRYGAQRVLLHRGQTFRWNFVGTVEHDVTLATGPVGIASPSMKSGSFSVRFTRAGTYDLYCSLHPARMTQTIVVR